MTDLSNIDPTGSFDSDVESLKISTLNVRGLRNNIKQNAIIQELKKLDLDIIALQETHLLLSDVSQIESKWGGHVFLQREQGIVKGWLFYLEKILLIAK